jgi:hypothetical protein
MQTHQSTASIIAEQWMESEPAAIPAGLQNDKGFGTILGFEVHVILEKQSEQAARSYYQKVLKFGT